MRSFQLSQTVSRRDRLLRVSKECGEPSVAMARPTAVRQVIWVDADKERDGMKARESRRVEIA